MSLFFINCPHFFPHSKLKANQKGMQNPGKDKPFLTKNIDFCPILQTAVYTAYIKKQRVVCVHMNTCASMFVYMRCDQSCQNEYTVLCKRKAECLVASPAWNTDYLSTQLNSRQERLVFIVVCGVFYNQGLVHYEFLPKGHTSNHIFFCTIYLKTKTQEDRVTL